jgi:hypothetical protein
MRFETSQIVGSIVESVGMGPFGRAGLELLPSLFLYPSQNRRASSSPGLYEEMSGSDDHRHNLGGGDDRLRSSIGMIRSDAMARQEINEASNI